MEFKISEVSDKALAEWFEMVRSTAEKNIKAGVDGLKFWQKELKPNLSDGPLNGYMWAPVSQERIEAAAINPSHFVDQQINIPLSSNYKINNQPLNYSHLAGTLSYKSLTDKLREEAFYDRGGSGN